MGFGGNGGGGGTIGSASDVAFNNPTNNQVITYDSSVGKWKNAAQASGFADPTSTKGDVIVRGASSTTRLGIGTDAQVLTADSTQATGVKWATPAAPPVTSVATKTGAVTLTSADVGLGNVDNTSDILKPVSNATQTALNAKADALASINAQTGTSYTLLLSDAGKFVTLSNGSATTVTVPANSNVGFSIGTRINFAQMGTGQVTFVAANGVSLFSDPGLKIAAQYGGAELVKLASDTWILVGRLAA